MNDEGQTKELGRFGTKSEAKQAAKRFMRNNPKGLGGNSFGGSIIPGANSGQDNGFF